LTHTGLWPRTADPCQRRFRIADPAASDSRSLPQIRLVVSDVDGTLVNNEKVLTARARDAVGRVLEAGIAFTIVSARPPRGMKMLIDTLGLRHPVAAFNGGMLVEPDLTILEERLIPEEPARQTIAILNRCGVEIWLYSECGWYVTNPATQRVKREEASVHFAPAAVTSYDGLRTRVAKLAGVCDDLDAMARCEQEVLRQCGRHVAAVRSQPDHLDVTHPQATKGAAVTSLAARLHVPLENVATIGDGPNDVSMFQVSGVSIAMGNAAPETQRAARFVTLSNQEDGFAAAMERYVLRPSAGR